MVPSSSSVFPISQMTPQFIPLLKSEVWELYLILHFTSLFPIPISSPVTSITSTFKIYPWLACSSSPLHGCHWSLSYHRLEPKPHVLQVIDEFLFWTKSLKTGLSAAYMPRRPFYTHNQRDPLKIKLLEHNFPAENPQWLSHHQEAIESLGDWSPS